MKRIFALLLAVALLLPLLPALADAEPPQIPPGEVKLLDVALVPGKTWRVYTGPGEQYAQANAGRAKLSTNGWVQVLGGADGGYLLVQYAVDNSRLRIGWISAEALVKWDFATASALKEAFHWRPAHLALDVSLTDDPLLSQAAVLRLKKGAQVSYLFRMGSWAYVEAADRGQPLCGFVPYGALEMDEVDLSAHPAYEYAAALLEKAGIAAEPTGVNPHAHTAYFALAEGGVFWAYWYGQKYDPLLTPLEFNWRFEGAADSDIAKYFDVALSMLAEVENGSIDAARNWNDVERAREVWVSNGLLYQEYLGGQALRVLLAQLAAHDGNDALNSLRARLASRLLGMRDKTEVDPALGCAWYDALRLAEQNGLPPVDAALYVSDPALLAATRLLTEQAEAEYATYSFGPEIDAAKCAALVSLGECAREEKGDTVTIWASMGRVLIAVYDGTDYRLASGSWYPVRVTLRSQGGEWTLAEVAEPEDGDNYWPTILKMCGGDEALAERLVSTGSGIHAATAAYLTACGYPEAARQSEGK